MRTFLTNAQSESAPESGMGRFFSPVAVFRYRTLVGHGLNEVDRASILTALAQEWSSFKRECRNGGTLTRAKRFESSDNSQPSRVGGRP
jgi:hypothetical protein